MHIFLQKRCSQKSRRSRFLYNRPDFWENLGKYFAKIRAKFGGINLKKSLENLQSPISKFPTLKICPKIIF